MTIRNNNKIIGSDRSKVMFWCLFSLVLLGFFSYGYFVRAAIVNIVARQEAEKEISDLNSKVLSLEAEYVKAKSNVDEDLAEEMGFVLASNLKFIDRLNTDQNGLSLNLR